MIFRLGRLLGREVVEGGVVRGCGGVLRVRPFRRGKRRMGVGGSCRDLLRRVGGGIEVGSVVSRGRTVGNGSGRIG